MRRRCHAAALLAMFAISVTLPAQRAADLRVAPSTSLAASRTGEGDSPTTPARAVGTSAFSPAARPSAGRERPCGNPAGRALLWGAMTYVGVFGLELSYLLVTAPLRAGDGDAWTPDPRWAAYAAGGAAGVTAAASLRCQRRRGG